MKKLMLILGAIIFGSVLLTGCNDSNNNESNLGPSSIIGNTYRSFNGENYVYIASENEALDFYSMALFNYTKEGNTITIENGKYYNEPNSEYTIYNNMLYAKKELDADDKAKGVKANGYVYQNITENSNTSKGIIGNTYKSFNGKNYVYIASENEALDFYSMALFNYTKEGSTITIENGKYYNEPNSQYTIYNNNMLYSKKELDADDKAKGVKANGYVYLLTK